MDEAEPPTEVPRFLQRQVEEALVDTRVVGVVGPRQAGKSTLVLDIVAGTPDAVYVSLTIATPRGRERGPDRFRWGTAGLGGGSNAEIAAELGMTVATVKAHVSHVLTKLDLDNRTQSALLVHDVGLA